MADDLKQYLDQHTPKGFRSGPRYFPDGDFVTCYFKNDRCYAQRLDDVVTVFLAIDSDELVGCKIKGVKHILQTAGHFGVTVDDGDVKLGFFFFLGAAQARDDSQKKLYEELRRMAKDASVNREEVGRI